MKVILVSIIKVTFFYFLLLWSIESKKQSTKIYKTTANNCYFNSHSSHLSRWMFLDNNCIEFFILSPFPFRTISVINLGGIIFNTQENEYFYLDSQPFLCKYIATINLPSRRIYRQVYPIEYWMFWKNCKILILSFDNNKKMRRNVTIEYFHGKREADIEYIFLF